jgi:CHAD domain-containing protein
VLTTRELAIEAIRANAAAFGDHTRALRANDDDRVRHVHQARVATRRLRAALKLFNDLLPEPASTLRDELKWIAALLGEARDAEVMAARLDAQVAGLPVEMVMGAVTARIDHVLGARYRTGLARAVEAMESERYLDLVAALDALVADPPWTAAAHEPAQDVVPRLVRRDHKRLRRLVEALERGHGDGAPDEAIHECRKAAKRLRYAAEAAQPVVGADAKRVVRAAKAAQTILGDHQDSVVTRQVLRQLGVQAHLDGDSAFTFGLLHGHEEQRAVELEEEFARAWRTELGPELRHTVP